MSYPVWKRSLPTFLLLASMLIKLDLPTFERPMKAYSGAWVEGHFPTEELLMTNSADLISMSVCIFFCWQIYAFLFGFWLSLHKFMYFDCR